MTYFIIFDKNIAKFFHRHAISGILNKNLAIKNIYPLSQEVLGEGLFGFNVTKYYKFLLNI